ncbi:MAG TPA: thioesterase family protein [Acidimicrobiales bacterium]|jgi:acyl-CoA thioesterase|nr:thioesterase family protein [Acidimicrobiales bacterium]
MASYAFDEATAATARGDGSSYDVDISERWTIGPGRPNGGYLLATVGRAALDACHAAGGTQPHPVSANVQYVASPNVGPGVVETEVLRIGRSASQVRARLVQGGDAMVEATFIFGHLHEGSSPYWGDEPPVDMPSEEECLAALPQRPPAPGVGDGPSMRMSVRQAFDPSSTAWMRGEQTGRGEFRSWFRFADDRPIDPLSLLFIVDALPPATFDVVQTGWVPTLDLTVYVRAVPAPGPVRMRFRAGVIQDGFVNEVMDVWDSAGRLVAQSTQLAAIRLPG